MVIKPRSAMPLALRLNSAPLIKTMVGPVGELTIPVVPKLRPEKKHRAIAVIRPARAPMAGSILYGAQSAMPKAVAWGSMTAEEETPPHKSLLLNGYFLSRFCNRDFFLTGSFNVVFRKK